MIWYFTTIDDYNKVVYDSRLDNAVFTNKAQAQKASCEFHTKHCKKNPGWWFATRIVAMSEETA